MGMNGDVIRALLAAAGGGASSLGTSLQQKNDPSRALELLLKQAQLKKLTEPEDKTQFHFDQEGNAWSYDPITRRLTPVKPEGSQSSAPPTAAPANRMQGSVTDALTRLGAGTGIGTTTQSASSDPQDPASPKFGPKTRPPTVQHLSFTEDDKPVEGSFDPVGKKYYHADGSLATGRIGPFTPPQRVPNIDAPGPDGTVVRKPDIPGQTVAKGGASATTSAQTMMALGRMRQLSSDLGSAIPAMEAFESPDSTMNIGKVGLGMKAAGTAAAAHPNVETHGGVVEGLSNAGASALQGVAQQRLASTPLGQKYRTYTTNQKRVGLGLAEILPRPNNALLGTEIALSGGDIGQFNPEQTKLIQDRRRNAKKGIDALLAMNPEFVAKMQEQDPDFINNFIHTTITTGAVPALEGAGTTPATPGAKPPTQDQKDWDAAVALHGRAKVLKEFGPRP